MTEILGHNWAYFFILILFVLGLYGTISQRNMVKKLVGLNILQSSIILIWVASAAKWGDTTVPIISHGAEGNAHGVVVHATDFINPLPHTLMLTAIVVGVATTGVAFALLISIYRRYGTFDEEKAMAQMSASSDTPLDDEAAA